MPDGDVVVPDGDSIVGRSPRPGQARADMDVHVGQETAQS